jgi:type IV secretion system protein VirB9
MIRLFTPLFLSLALFPASLHAQDNRVETIAYQAGQVIPLRSAEGNGLTIIFAPGERVLGFEVADPDAVEVHMWASPDSLFLKTLRQPADPRLTVRTQLRNYDFLVQTGPSDKAAFVVRFVYDRAAEPITNVSKSPAKPVFYRLTGEKALHPSRISDDGMRTYLEWGPDQPLPAVFAVNPFGDEEMVDGYMRGGIFTIDRVHLKLVFRIDKKLARAERLQK